jgi:hypothetical protein
MTINSNEIKKGDVIVFREVLNDLVDYFILGDVFLLNDWRLKNNLPEDLATVFVTSDDGDNLEKDGILLPMWGIENYPYTIIFNFSDTPELLKSGNNLQIRQSGYSLKVENNILVLFTWAALNQVNAEKMRRLTERATPTSQSALMGFPPQKKPIVTLENGWYSVEVLGGESLQPDIGEDGDGDEYLEPTFEFLLKKVDANQHGDVDTAFRFELSSSSY